MPRRAVGFILFVLGVSFVAWTVFMLAGGKANESRFWLGVQFVVFNVLIFVGVEYIRGDRPPLPHEPHYSPEGPASEIDIGWMVEDPREIRRVLSGFLKVLPAGSALMLEGVRHPELVVYLRKNEFDKPRYVKPGTIWPKPDIYHAPLTESFIEGLFSVMDAVKWDVLCDHYKAYHEGVVLMEWHDADVDEPILFSSRIPESAVREFARNLPAKLTPWKPEKGA